MDDETKHIRLTKRTDRQQRGRSSIRRRRLDWAVAGSL